MPIYKDPEREEIDRRLEWEDREWAAEQEQRKRDHQYKLAQLRVRTETRHKTIGRAVIALAKAPAWTVLAITIPILQLKGREVPQVLQDFMSL